MDTMKQIEDVIVANKPKIVALVGNADEAVTDEGLRKIAGLLHGLLPFPVRLVLKKDMVASVLVTNRSRVRLLLTTD